MRKLFAWAAQRAATVLAISAVAGCGGTVRSTGSQGGGSIARCSTPRFCHHVQQVGSPQQVDLGPIADGNVQLGSGVMTQLGPVVPWGERSCCSTPSQAAAGFALLEQQASMTIWGPATVPAPFVESPLPLFARGSEIDAVEPAGNYDKVHRYSVPALDELGAVVAAAPLPTPRAVGERVVSISDDQSGTHVVLLDASLSKVLARQDDSGLSAAQATLSPSCEGLVGTGIDGAALVSVAVDDTGLATPAHTLLVDTGGTKGRRTAAWDGREVVLTDGKQVLELDAHGLVFEQTTLADQPLAAAGTDDGLLVLVNTPDGLDPKLLLVARGSGKVVKDLGLVYLGGMYAATALAVSEPGRVYFAASSYTARNAVVWVGVDCGS